jgi:outer membrane receptor for ferrienterochelin and colicin
MRLPRVLALGAAMAALFTSAYVPRAHAQGITTGAIGGTVTDEAGAPMAGVQIRAKNPKTGFTAGVLSRADGRFFIQNLDIGTYDVEARRIGFEPQTRTELFVSLGQVLRLDFKLSARATQLAGIKIVSTTSQETFTPSNTGIKATVTDSTIQRMATISRNLADFSKIAPQVSSSGPGYSAGGMSNRMNNVQIDGATERDVFGLGSTGQPGAEVNARSIPLEAVKEVQVLLAPYDVRQGNFGGLLLNAVTKSGTNDIHGTAYAFYRNQDYGRNTPVLRSTTFDRKTYGLALGGPITKDRLHFFVAVEAQEEHAPLSGPFQGQDASISPKFPFAADTVTKYLNAVKALGQKDPGTAGLVTVPNPLRNFFGRIDWRLNDIHRLVARYNYDNAENPDRAQNSRSSTRSVFSDNLHDFKTFKSAPVVQLFSNFHNGTFNELFIGENTAENRRTPLTQFPQIAVSTVNLASGGGTGSIIGGADQFSQGNELDQHTYEFTDNYTMPHKNHTFTVGTRNEYVKIRNLFTQSSFGVWNFKNLDSLAAGNANGFRKAVVLSNGGNVYFNALQSAVYGQDQWQVSPRLAMTLGARFDMSNFLKDIPYNPAIDSAYGRRTDEIPKHSVQFSPRFGFNWDVTGNQINQIRGGLGFFVGTPPYVWLENVYVNSGTVITFLNCGASFGNSSATSPSFVVDPTTQNSCRNINPSKPIGDVNFLNKDLKFPQPMRAALGYDRQLPHDLVFSFEAMASKTNNQFLFVNRNLQGIRGYDRNGRVLYADTIRAATGVSVPVRPTAVVANGGTSRFTTAIDVINQSKDLAWNLTESLRKRYSNHWEGYLAYTYGRAKDAQSFTSSTHISNWQFGRTLLTDQLKPTESISLFDQRHKVVADATYTFEFKRGWATDFTMFYQGVSGAPHDYVYLASSGSGDLNGDGVSGNDLVYVPKDAHNPFEIQFKDVSGGGATAAQQADAFEKFIKNSPCLSAHRGQILPRNSCRQPFLNQVDLNIRQTIPSLMGQRLSVQADIFNFGNLLNKTWGQQRVTEQSSNSNVGLLTHVGQTSSDPRAAIPIVQFNTKQNEYIVGAFASNYYRFQLSVKYSF